MLIIVFLSSIILFYLKRKLARWIIINKSCAFKQTIIIQSTKTIIIQSTKTIIIQSTHTIILYNKLIW